MSVGQIFQALGSSFRNLEASPTAICFCCVDVQYRIGDVLTICLFLSIVFDNWIKG